MVQVIGTDREVDLALGDQYPCISQQTQRETTNTGYLSHTHPQCLGRSRLTSVRLALRQLQERG